MDAKVLPSSSSFSSSFSSSHLARRRPPPSLCIPPVRGLQPLQAINNGGAAGDDINNSDNREDPTVSTATPRSAPPPPPTRLKIKYRARSRNQAKQQQQEQLEQASARPPPPPPKKWEDMTLGEKAMELYVGEKGLLFWLNKFAYASIFIVIGGWILFRFVGPSIGLYQLDTPPLSPTSVFKGS